MRTSNHRKCEVASAPNTRNSDFGHLLIDCGLTKAKLARLVDVHPNTVTAWATGAREVPRAVMLYLGLLADVRRLAGC
mgnify:CR=1 FL=1